jgi:hypothetical protein
VLDKTQIAPRHSGKAAQSRFLTFHTSFFSEAIKASSIGAVEGACAHALNARVVH